MTKKNPNSKYGRLNFTERVTIKNMIDAGKTNADIARKLNRPRATITHELQRNARVMTAAWQKENIAPYLRTCASGKTC